MSKFSPITVQQFKKHKTPFYVYDTQVLNNTLKKAATAAHKYGVKVNYAIKANNNAPILNEINKYFNRIDTVSANEIKHAHKNGFALSKISFAGAGKTTDELLYAIRKQIACIYIESIEELQLVSALANKLKLKVNIGIRINPKVDAKTHKYITTGLEENKNGIAETQILEALKLISQNKYLVFYALHVHVGSNILDLSVFEKLSARMQLFIQKCSAANAKPKVINMGGGLGINYNKPFDYQIDFENYFKSLLLHIDTKQFEIHVELGRSLVAHAGTLITRVLYNKKMDKQHFLIVDAGFTELIRPALYQAYHAITPLNSKSISDELYQVVGPICESSDVFSSAYSLPIMHANDLIAIETTGAYGEVMSSNYNLRKRYPSKYI